MPKMVAPYHWSHRVLTAFALLPVSWIYWVVVSLRLALVKQRTLPVPVICVGNNTAGGAGKTPTAIAIAQILQKEGFTPAFISRGYLGNYIGTIQVDASTHAAVEVGDEPLILAKVAPCYVSKRRMHAAQRAIDDGATHIIMDDGLQNPSLYKDVTILVVDGGYGFGNGFMMPAGPAREPVSASMKKADAAMVMGEQKEPRIEQYFSRFWSEEKPIHHAKMKASMDLSGKRLHPFAGIALPDKFFATVEEQGGEVIRQSRFPDHHMFTTRDLERLRRESQEDNAQLITTEKDAARLPEEFLPHVLVLPAALQIEGHEAFEGWLLNQLKEKEVI